MKKPSKLNQIGLGGGCHWCTEALYQSLLGVQHVEQGFIASVNNDTAYSEAVVVHFDPETISLKTLIEIHLNTHDSTKIHSMSEKYRSAIYTFSDEQRKEVRLIINQLQLNFSKQLITKILTFNDFRFSNERFRNYYYSNPDKPFCRNYISPKLQLLRTKFSNALDSDKINTIKNF